MGAWPTDFKFRWENKCETHKDISEICKKGPPCFFRCENFRATVIKTVGTGTEIESSPSTLCVGGNYI